MDDFPSCHSCRGKDILIGKTEEMISAFNRILQKERGEKRKVLRENTVYRESITSISHDIRTPLTSAKGYLQMLQNKDTAVKKRKNISQLWNSVWIMSRIC